MVDIGHHICLGKERICVVPMTKVAKGSGYSNPPLWCNGRHAVQKLEFLESSMDLLPLIAPK